MPKGGDDKPKRYERGDKLFAINYRDWGDWVLDNAVSVVFVMLTLFTIYLLAR